jgi:hypothetical protein
VHGSKVSIPFFRLLQNMLLAHLTSVDLPTLAITFCAGLASGVLATFIALRWSRR